MIDLNLPEMLSENDMTVHDIAKSLSIEESRIIRLLRTAASIGLVELQQGNVVRATEALKLLRKSLLAPLITSRGITTYGAWSHLSTALVSSETAFELHHGMHVGEYIENGCKSTSDNERCEAQKSVRTRIQNKCDMCHSIFQSTLRVIPWNEFIPEKRSKIRVCDLGSGDQTDDLSLMIETIFRPQSDTQVHGMVFDLPGVLGEQNDEFERVEGNLFSSVPSADVFILKHVLHAGDDGTCLQILEVIESSLNRDGMIIVVDPVLHENSSSVQYLDDLNLFITGGGRDRTRFEWLMLFEKSGFEVMHIEVGSDSFCGSSVIILKKKAAV